MNPKRCPECDSYDTTMEWDEHLQDTVLVTRTCNGCPTQYTVVYGNPIIEEVVDYDE